jgi:hypothetical protein
VKRPIRYDDTPGGQAALVGLALRNMIHLDPPDDDVWASLFGSEPCAICKRQTRFEVRAQGRGKSVSATICSSRCKKKFLLDRWDRGILRPGHGVEPDDRFEVEATDSDGVSVTKITKDDKP